MGPRISPKTTRRRTLFVLPLKTHQNCAIIRRITARWNRDDNTIFAKTCTWRKIIIFKHVYLFSGTASNIPSFIQMSDMADFAQQKAAALLLVNAVWTWWGPYWCAIPSSTGKYALKMVPYNRRYCETYFLYIDVQNLENYEVTFWHWPSTPKIYTKFAPNDCEFVPILLKPRKHFEYVS